MTDEKHGPASFAATALATSPLAENLAPTTNPNALVVGAAPQTNPGAPVAGPQSGVGPTTASAPSEQAGSGPIGRTIHGRYKIKRLLGEGGMGGVYEGEHLEIGKRVAIKLVHSLHARDPHVAARIKQEARSTGAIESENIVQVFDAGEDPDLGLFLVMEMLKGEDLGSLLARKKRVSPMAAATMVVQAAQGLSRAHAAGIVHRDLKPANIFLCTRDDGSSLVKLVDFGIAKLVRDANQANQQPGLTRMGMVIGTPQYMSPEQAQGLTTVDHRTDVYSLGAVLYEAIVGASPYKEMPTYEQTILQIMTRPAPRISATIPEIAPDLDQLCADMMAHDPAQRPADMSIVRERLIRIFPEIEGGRLPMRSLTNEMGYDATLAADASGQVKAQVEAALARAGLSGVGLAVPRPSSAGTQSALAVNSSTDEEPVDDVAGVPKKKSGALVGAVAVVALLAGIGGVAFVKMHSGPAAPPAVAGYGLVQSTVALPAATTAPQAAAEPAAVAAPTATAPAKPAAAAKPAPAPVAAAAPAAAADPAPAAPAKPARPAKAASQPADKPEKGDNSRMVGGTGESTEF
jgi:serine/threonine-protein kinase